MTFLPLKHHDFFNQMLRHHLDEDVLLKYQLNDVAILRDLQLN